MVLEQSSLDELKRLLEQTRQVSEIAYQQIELLIKHIDQLVGMSDAAPIRSPRRLTSPQKQQLVRALLSAFPSYSSLTMMVDLQFGEKLVEITPTAGTLKEIVYGLI